MRATPPQSSLKINSTKAMTRAALTFALPPGILGETAYRALRHRR